MNWKWMRRAEEPVEMEPLEPALAQALDEFKSSVHAWSEAAYHRERTAQDIVMRRTWRMAAGWSLASLLLAGSLAGGLYERHHQQEIARVAAAQAAEHQRQLAAQRAQEEAQQEDDLLAGVDSAVSREVPSAMEPLAQLTDESESR